MLEETDRVRLSLRRYTEPGCHGPGSWGYHDASAPIGDAKVIWEPAPDRDGLYLALRPERLTIVEDDPRWPQKCRWCEHRFAGFPFNPQVNQHLYYRRADTGAETLLHEAPHGAVWFAPWMGKSWSGPDGKSVMVKVPDNIDWCVDGPAGNAPGVERAWTRTGVPPKLTVRPSIQTPNYHGYLTDGVLAEC